VDPACLDRATRRGGLARALRRPAKISPDLLDDPAAMVPSESKPSFGANRLESIG
jgi:hypothetical protein